MKDGHPPLQATGLRHHLGGRLVVDGVSLALRGGERAAIVGPNGAGKSTLLQLLAGLRRPDEGEVRLRARALDTWPARARAAEIAWLGQHAEAEGEIAAQEVVMLGRLPHLGLFGTPGASDRAAVVSAMQLTDCAALAGRRLNALSGGERQRVLLARALAVQAPLLLLDEPTTHLDAPHQGALMRALSAHAAAGGSVLAVLHDLSLALACERVLVLAGGRLLADGAPGDAALQDALVRAFGGGLRVVALPAAPGADDARATRWAVIPDV